MWTFAVTLIVFVGVSLLTKPKPTSELKDVCFGETQIPSSAHLPLLKKSLFWGCALLAGCIVLNVIFW